MFQDVKVWYQASGVRTALRVHKDHLSIRRHSTVVRFSNQNNEDVEPSYNRYFLLDFEVVRNQELRMSTQTRNRQIRDTQKARSTVQMPRGRYTYGMMRLVFPVRLCWRAPWLDALPPSSPLLPLPT